MDEYKYTHEYEYTRGMGSMALMALFMPATGGFDYDWPIPEAGDEGLGMEKEVRCR